MSQKLQDFCIKFIEFEDESRETNRGLLLLAVWVSFLEYLGAFGVRLEVVRSSVEDARRTPRLDLQPSIWGFFLMFLGNKWCHCHRLSEGFKAVGSDQPSEQSSAVGFEEEDQRVNCMSHLSRARCMRPRVFMEFLCIFFLNYFRIFHVEKFRKMIEEIIILELSRWKLREK